MTISDSSQYDNDQFEKEGDENSALSPNPDDDTGIISGLSERLRLMSSGVIHENNNQEVEGSTVVGAPVVEAPVKQKPSRPNLKLQLNADMLSTAKAGLTPNPQNAEDEPKRPKHYVPMSPLNLKSPILVNALQKGKLKLRKTTTTVAEEESTEEKKQTIVRINSRGGMTDKNKDEERTNASERLVAVLKENIESAKKSLVHDDVIVASNAYVYGTGRFGRVVKGVIRAKKIKKRQMSRFERHKKATFRDLNGADLEESHAEPDIQVAVKQVLHKRSYLPPGLLKTMIHEVEALEKCAGPGVLGLVGVAVIQPKLSIVTQLFNKGSLHSLIRSQGWEKLEFKHKAKVRACEL